MHPITPRWAGLAPSALALLLCASASAQTSASLATWNTFAKVEDKPAAAAPGAAKLVLLRPPSPQDSRFPADVLVDGRLLSSLLPGGFAEVDLCPGPKQLELAGQGTSGMRFKPRHQLNALPGRTTYVLVQAPTAEQPLRSDLSADQAEVWLKDLRRQTHAVSRVQPALNCPPPPPEPTPVAQALPAPVVAAPPPPRPAPEPRTFTLSAEMLFAFGGSQPKHLAERGRQEIVALAQQLKAELQSTDHVLVQGHTDPMGSDALNQRLSSERASTVRSILIGQGLAPTQVSAQGMGSSQLLVKDCAKRHARRDDRIFCDLPNRRVEITVAPLMKN